MMRNTLTAVLLCLSLGQAALAADTPPIEMSVVVPAPPDKVWAAFTTTEGVKSWMVSQAEIEMKIGAIWKTKYGPQGTLGDEGTIFNELLAFDPGRMYAIRIHKPPKGFPFMSVYRDMWTVVYFVPADGGKTLVTLRGHGFTDNEESRKMRSFFLAGNKATLDALVKHFEKAAPKAQAMFTGRARDVLADGTVVVQRSDDPAVEERVRLWGVTLPNAGEPQSKDALSRLKDLTVGLVVRVIPRERLADGSVAGVVRSSDATFLYQEVYSGTINHIMVLDGMARRNPEVDTVDPDLARHENAARKGRRGVWRG